MRARISANAIDLFFCKFTCPAKLTRGNGRTPPFFIHVLQIVVLCSKEKMFRIYTRLVIASVKNKHSVRNCPDIFLIRKSVGIDNFTVYAEMSVPGIVGRRAPYMAV